METALRLKYLLHLAVVMLPALLLAACGAGGTTATPTVPTLHPEAELQPIQVDDIRIEIGVGSPIPVNVLVSGQWPDLCAQIASVEQSVSGERITINLLATAAKVDCPPDLVGLPFSIAIPLNMVEMPAGTYTVVVNGVEARFEWSAASGPDTGGDGLAKTVMAYIGPDGNLWVLEWPGGATRQLTEDATPLDAFVSGTTVSYYFPVISSDGARVAARRDVGTPVSYGMQFESGLWSYSLETGESKQVYGQQPTGFSWKPNTHVLAFARAVPAGYFQSRGEKPDAALANDILGFDVDTGAAELIVGPENGYALASPVWSPDGRYLAFDELIGPEGRGNFAYFDLEGARYVSAEEPLGGYSWSPDGTRIAHDDLTYSPTGTEQIYVREVLSGAEQLFYAPADDAAYAISPVFSPMGDAVAFLVNLGNPDSQSYVLHIQAWPSGETKPLGEFLSVLSLGWTADGSHLVFSAGEYNHQELIAVDVASGESQALGEGSQPSLSTK